MENHRRSQVIGDPHAPFLTSLARSCAQATDYRAVGSPSLPNYLAATSGQTHGVHDDGAPASHPIGADNLFRQVRAAGGTARSYVEAMPTACALRPAGRYAVKHNPAAYYIGDGDRKACASEDLPLGTPQEGPLADDLAAGRLPDFAFVVPDLCHDTHDCAVAVGDEWVSQWITRLVSDPTYAAGTTALFVVWDEPTPMPFIAVAPSIHPGTVITTAVDHYSLLRTTEELLGINAFLGTARTAPSMRLNLGL
jgi:phospholipase C